jgi:hypothetical protein
VTTLLTGTRGCISGYSHDLIREDDDGYDNEDEDKRIITEEIDMAQKFDRKLTKEVSQGETNFVDITPKLGG